MANIKLFMAQLLKHEGGKVDHKNDPGGATNKGITLSTWQSYGRDLDADGDIDKADLWKITTADAEAIYARTFWNAMALDKVKSQSLAEIIMDHGVNAGASRAIKMAQYLLNKYFNQKLQVDGKAGPGTVQAINNADPEMLFNFYKKLRQDYYTYRAASLAINNPNITFFKTQLKVSPSMNARVFINGWLNRVATFKYKDQA